MKLFCYMGKKSFGGLCYLGKKSVTFPLSCGHLAQEPAEARGAHPPTHLECYSIYVTCYSTIWNRVQLLKISRSPLPVLVYVFVSVLSFILVW